MSHLPSFLVCCLCFRAVELGITAEDLIIAEEQEVVSSPRRPLPAVDSDGEVTRALVYNSRDTYLQFWVMFFYVQI